MKSPMTPRGYATLRSELMRLKASRVDLAKAIEIARGHGDLSENGDYDAAKNKSGMTEAKIRDIELKLSSADVIDPRKLSNIDRVVFGVTVEIEDVDSGEKKRLSIVGNEESDITKGWISFESPLGKSLIGKQEGDIARVNLPAGKKEYEIMSIVVDYTEDAVEAEA